jgi:hypothetical protein
MRAAASGRAALSRHASAEVPIRGAVSRHAPAWAPCCGPHGRRTSLVLLAGRGPWGAGDASVASESHPAAAKERNKGRLTPRPHLQGY